LEGPDPFWSDLVTTPARTITLPLAGPAGFFRVQDRATKTVQLFAATLSGAAERPTPVVTTGTGRGYLSIEAAASKAWYYVAYDKLQGDGTDAHIHGPADATAFAGVLAPLTAPTGRAGFIWGVINPATPALINAATAGNTYFNIHTTFAGGGEIRGQITAVVP
jgi:CHRD domain